MMEAYLTAREFRARLDGKISTKTMANWRSAGRGPRFRRIGNKILYPMSAIQEWEAKTNFVSTRKTCSREVSQTPIAAEARQPRSCAPQKGSSDMAEHRVNFSEAAHDAHARLRDEFAMAAMTGLLANASLHADMQFRAEAAYEIADAMLEARNAAS